jgi:hypothetical protein
MEMPVPFSLRQAPGKEDRFRIRRAVERIREGLFDPVAVQLLTAHEERLRVEVGRGFQALDAGRSPHLCVVGAYGQGKSHSLAYIRDAALKEGFAASLINLDPREVPFRQFRQVYRELMAHLELPGSDGSFSARWKMWARQQLKQREDLKDGLAGLLPERMPHHFKAVLAAMADGPVPSSENERSTEKHWAFQSGEVPMLLARALEGGAVPVYRLKNAFKLRQVSFYKDGPLGSRGIEPFMEMIRALSCLFRQMGYRGWVILFDEAESIAQANVSARSKSYSLLHRMFAPDGSGPAFVYPVFAFTDDFFQRVHQEDYEKVKKRRETVVPYFERNYAREWQHLTIYRLHDLSRKEWTTLSRRLIDLHGMAYGWQPPEERLTREMACRLDAAGSQETRLKLKALVDCMDLVHQEQVL